MFHEKFIICVAIKRGSLVKKRKRGIINFFYIY